MDKQISTHTPASDSRHNAAQVITAVRQLTASDELGPPMTTKERRRQGSEGRFSPAFVEAVSAALVANQEVVGNNFDPAAIRDDMAFVATYVPVQVAVRSLERRIGDEILRRKAKVAVAANGALAVMQALSRTEQGAVLLDEVAALSSLKRRPARTRKDKAAQASPSPSASDKEEPKATEHASQEPG